MFGYCLPLLVKAMLAAITSNHSVKLFGVRTDTVDNVVAAIMKPIH